MSTSNPLGLPGKEDFYLEANLGGRGVWFGMLLHHDLSLHVTTWLTFCTTRLWSVFLFGCIHPKNQPGKFHSFFSLWSVHPNSVRVFICCLNVILSFSFFSFLPIFLSPFFTWQKVQKRKTGNTTWVSPCSRSIQSLSPPYQGSENQNKSVKPHATLSPKR